MADIDRPIGSASRITLNRQVLEDALRPLQQYRINVHDLNISPDGPVGEGGYGAVRLANLTTATGTISVAVKHLRIDKGENIPLRVAYRLAREMIVWCKWNHPNVLRFLGYHLSDDLQTAYLISPLMTHGNVKDYLVKVQAGPDERMKFILDTLEGLRYLHTLDPPVVHGGLKSANVLVNNRRRGVLCDFGLSMVTESDSILSPLATPTVSNFHGSFRWCSPEVVLGGTRTLPSDMWGWACLVLEMVTDNYPFPEANTDLVALGHIVQNKSPEPLTPWNEPFAQVFELSKRCWRIDPEERPSVDECVSVLGPPPPLPPLRKKPAAAGGSKGKPKKRPQNVSLEEIEDIAASITISSDVPNNITGHFCDLFVGTGDTLGKVALKRPRMGSKKYSEAEIRRFIREAETWRTFDHEFILRFIGTCIIDDYLYMVSPFIENGTLSDFLNQHPNVDRLRLLNETALAVAYLHSINVIHGDIKGTNILVSNTLHALLCDFGLTKFASSSTSTNMKSVGSVRWQSPELLMSGPKTFQSDTYAFGITVAEVLAGTVPFPHHTQNASIIMGVLMADERPKTKPMFSKAMSPYYQAWQVAIHCWLKTPSQRPPMEDVAQRLKPTAQPQIASEMDDGLGLNHLSLDQLQHPNRLISAQGTLGGNGDTEDRHDNGRGSGGDLMTDESSGEGQYEVAEEGEDYEDESDGDEYDEYDDDSEGGGGADADDDELEEGTYCYCLAHDLRGDAVSCVDADCKLRYFHLRCLGMAAIPEGEWRCLDCEAAKLKSAV